MRLPPNNIQMLLPVWGARYTSDFLDLCLPSLLAPGNIPALSKLAPCTLVLLAPVRDAEVIKQSALWGLLLRYCEVRIEPIDDLVSESSSTVLTLAYALAIREAGQRALDTCFVPLVADYVLSDGSLSKVVGHIFAGASAVLAGNFQIEREAAFLDLEANRNNAGVLAVTSRALVELSFGALHQATLAQIVDADSRFNPHTNRLFWRVDDHCMVGRFFLMHMIAIRPETSDFVIAASSDYSLVPELCPSGDVVRMTDSDDYFAVECQPRGYHPPALSAGRLNPRAVANGLASWATALHRENAQHALVFHCGPHSPRLREKIAFSQTFVLEVDALTTTAPMPFRHHPFWPRSLEHHAATASVEQDPARLAAITADPVTAATTGSSGVSRLRVILLGRAPSFRPWHPRWLDARALQQRLAVLATNGKVLVVADVPARVRLWLERETLAAGAISVTQIPTADLRTSAGVGSVEAAIDCCVFLAPDLASAELPKILSGLAPLVRPGGAIVLGIGRIFSDTVGALPSIVPPADLVLANGRLVIERIDGVSGEPRRIAVQRAMMQFARNFSRPSSITSLFFLATAAGLAAISLCFNWTLVARAPALGRSQFTSLFFTFRRSMIETIGGELSSPRDESGDAVQSKIGETPATNLQSQNCITKERSRPICALRATSQDAAGFAMRGDRR
jgi:hypothetical protein